MEPTELNPSDEIAATLNFCDRVEILNMMMHDSENPLSVEDMDTLLGEYYPSYRHLCEDLRGEKVVSSAQASFSEDGVEFHVTFTDDTKYSAQYNEIEQDA